MMKPLSLICVLVATVFFAGCELNPKGEEKDKPGTGINGSVETEKVDLPKQIILTLGSWRKSDVEQINFILQKFTEKFPHIVVKFDPTSPSEYNEVIEIQLVSGTAPDLFYLRSFSHSKKLFDQGYLASLTDLPGLRNSFSPQMLEAWSSSGGVPYGVPLMAVSHGIYYNVSLFKARQLVIPDTWEKLLVLSEGLKKEGFIPFANATGEVWTINGLILQNVIPSIIGGPEGRMAYYTGERCFNDDQMIAAYQAIEDISYYISDNQKVLSYADSQQLFLQGKAAMWFGGSWDIPFFEAQSPEFEWSVFAIPPPAGKEAYVTFHPDAGIGLNQSSPYLQEAKLFLEWMTTSEFASLIVDQLPGFFPLHSKVTELENEHANTFLNFNKTHKTDIRFAWGRIRDGDPNAYELSLQTSVDVMNHVISPKQASDILQAGLSEWYPPAAQCPR